MKLQEQRMLWIESEDRGHPNISEFGKCLLGSYEFEDDSVERRPQVLLLLDIGKMPKTESVEEIVDLLDKLDLSMMSLFPDLKSEGPLENRKVVGITENEFLTDLGWTWKDLVRELYKIKSSLQGRRPFDRMIEIIGRFNGDVDKAYSEV